jgi:hypothetical protein
VRATISPGNVASLATTAGFGFAEVGEQWDEQDGRELIFEVAARTSAPLICPAITGEPARSRADRGAPDRPDLHTRLTSAEVPLCRPYRRRCACL